MHQSALDGMYGALAHVQAVLKALDGAVALVQFLNLYIKMLESDF